MIIIAIGGGRMYCRPPPYLKTLHYARLLHAKDKGAKATMPHDGSHPAMPSRGNFQGKSYKSFKDLDLRVGAVRSRIQYPEF